MRIIAILMATIISFMSSGICYADTTNNVKAYNYENDIKMNGVISSNEKFFNVNSNWNVKNAKLNLVFTKSELLDVDYSTITIFVNDTPIESQKLSGKKEYKKDTVIDIPKDLIIDGYNKVTIKAYKTISDLVCRDDSNTANWLVLHKESNISVQYDYKESNNFISDYNNDILQSEDGLSLNTTLLIPDKYSSSELSAGMILSSNFGNKLKYDNFNFEFQKYSDLKNKNKNIIFIGKENNSPSEILNLFSTKEKENLNKNCVIKQTSSPFNKSNKILLILSNNDDLIKNASKLLSSNNIIKSLNKNVIIINENTDVSDLDKEINNRISLKQLGYENLEVKGPFTQEITFDVNTPKNKIVTSSSKLHFNIRYADNLDFDRSLVTIYVNDIPIGSKKLSKDKSNNDSLELNLPKEVIEKNYYGVKVVFNLELLDVQCVTRDTDNPWAYISNDSYFDFDYKDNNSLNFKSYPYPFVENNKFNNLNIVVPNNSSSNDLTTLANTIAYMGRDVDFNSGELNVVKENELKSKDKDNNLLIYGTPYSNPLIKDLNKDLNIKFTNDYKEFESNDKIKFVNNYASELTSIQLLKSPYNKNKNIMVITSTKDKYLPLVTTYLSDLVLAKKLTGDTIVLGENNYKEELNYNSKNDDLNEEVREHKTLNNNSKMFIIMSIFLLVTIIISTILLIKKYKR